MTDGLLGGVRQRALEYASLFEIGIFIGLLYLVYIAPYRVFTGDADFWEGLAAIPGLCFWALVFVAVSRWLG